MAVILSEKRKFNCVRIISKVDSAVDANESDWDLYNEDPLKNEDALKFKPNSQPTIFVCNFEVTGKESAIIKDAMLAGMDSDNNAKVSYGKWAYTVVKTVLKSIENPAGERDVIEFKKDGRGYVADDTLTKLEKYGILTEIFTHWITLTQSDVRDNAKN